MSASKAKNKKYVRVCSGCNTELVYSWYSSWYKAKKNNALCLKCVMERRRKKGDLVALRIKEQYDKGLTNRGIAEALNMHHRSVAYHLQKLKLVSNWDKRYPPIEMVNKEEARCVKCKTVKPIGQFLYGRKGQKYEYRFSYCTECRKRQLYLNLNSDVDKFLLDRYNRLKLRSKKLNIIFKLSKPYFIDLYHSQKGRCFYTHEVMSVRIGEGVKRNSLSMDKIVPEKGYIVGNVVFCSKRINTIKSDLTLEELKKWIPKWYKKIQKRLPIS
jgi:DNA-directed RNA polymerase subunit M/transcription elongation factor TFIIS